MKIDVLCSSVEHPIFLRLDQWVQKISKEHDIRLIQNGTQTASGDFLFLISCNEVIPQKIRALYKHTLVVHASDLPRGRGWSPHIWQVVEGAKSIPVTLLEAADKVDEGAIWKQVSFALEGHELYDEINDKLFAATFELLEFAIASEGTVQPQPQSQAIKPSYYAKRTPTDSAVDVNKTMAEQFDLMRVADPHRFPNFFEFRGQKYELEIRKKNAMAAQKKTSTAISIGDRKVGAGFEPLIVAEMSGNHNQSLERALEIVESAAKAGAHALKIQTYTAETMTLPLKENEFFIKDPSSLWQGSSLFDLYKNAYTPWEWHEPIFRRCKELGMIGFSSPFDPSAVDFLEKHEVPLYKIASFELVDLPLIKKVAATGKPMIMSTGMATLAEISDAVTAAREAGCKELVLLKCTSTYPATPENTNISTIPHMRELFGCPVGLSDHTMGVGVAVAAVSFGAVMIEKHFTLRRADGGVDSAFSLEPNELQSLVTETQRAWQAVGKISYGPTEKEKSSMVFRRSLYIAEDLRAGDTLTEKNLRIIRPGYGLAPKYYSELLGKRVRKDVPCGTPMSWDII